uniref:Uncharacterized protein n=1 Tax=Oryza brachyantha TaxID=4533 RepID=J3NCR8_ORYBR
MYLLPPRAAVVFQSESSAVDLACLVNRLTSLARKGGCGTLGPSPIEALFAGGRQQHRRIATAPRRGRTLLNATSILSLFD